MRIGLTYDLRSEYLAAGYSEEETAEFDREETVDAIDQALQQLGHQTDRIGHARQLVARLAQGDRWDLVFNICEGLRGAGREAQVPSLLELYGINATFADSLMMGVCLHKGLTKLVVRNAGVPTPAFVEIADLRQLDAVALRYPLFAKPIAEGTGKGVTPKSVIDNAAALREHCNTLLHQFHQHVLVEELLPGREFTVGLVGTGDDARVLGTLEIILLEGAEQGVYSYVNKERCEELVEYRFVPNTDPVVAKAEAVALKAWRALHCRDAGRIDLRCAPNGEPEFIEANPLAGLHPSHSDLPMLCTAIQMPYVELIREIVDSAKKRG